MKNIFLFLLMIFIIGAVLPACGEGGTETGNPTEEADDGVEADSTDEEVACLDAGGEWTGMGPCGDLCDSGDQDCSEEMLVLGCDCGDELCWTGDECEEI